MLPGHQLQWKSAGWTKIAAASHHLCPMRQAPCGTKAAGLRTTRPLGGSNGRLIMTWRANDHNFERTVHTGPTLKRMCLPSPILVMSHSTCFYHSASKLPVRCKPPQYKPAIVQRFFLNSCGLRLTDDSCAFMPALPLPLPPDMPVLRLSFIPCLD